MLKKYQLRSYNIRLVIALLITSGFGIIVINSANSAYTIRQCIGLAISLFLMAAVSFIDYNWILKYYWLIYIVNLAALLAVKLFGHESHGAKRWIKVPLIGQFQPSEFTKLLLILFTVKLLCMYKDKINDWRFLTILAILLAIPLAFILKQPNLSTTLLTFLILFTVIFCAGLSYKIIGIALLIIVPVVSGFMIYISNPDNKVFFIQDYQRTRIMAFLNSDANEYDDSNYQQEYAERAIGSGQLSGKGLNNDDPSSLKNVQNLKYFLFKSLKNRLIDILKSEINKEAVYERIDFTVNDVTILDSLIEEEERFELSQKIKLLLEQLTFRQREAVCLRYIYNMEYEEIADLLNMNNSKSARNLVSRALEHIRNEESGIFILLFLYNQPNFAADILIL